MHARIRLGDDRASRKVFSLRDTGDRKALIVEYDVFSVLRHIEIAPLHRQLRADGAVKLLARALLEHDLHLHTWLQLAIVLDAILRLCRSGSGLGVLLR